jgi:hypothetical protein
VQYTTLNEFINPKTNNMKNKIIRAATLLSAFALCSNYKAQNYFFDNITANGNALNKKIEWPTSPWGQGFAHKIYNDDYGGKTYLKIAGRHNSATFIDIATFTSDGLMGLGTNAPVTRFSIESNENQTSLGRNSLCAMRLSNGYTNAFGRRSEIQFGVDQNPNNILAVIASEYTAWSGSVGGDIVFGTSPGTSTAQVIERMRITSSGRLFVGTKRVISTHIHANADFQFDGKIACKELVVLDPTKWADYVFADGYQMKTLAEVETYYKQNRHLPDVPSEQEVKENGISTADMDATLLQKIEELTIYMVDYSKRVEKLEKENADLKARLEK